MTSRKNHDKLHFYFRNQFHLLLNTTLTHIYALILLVLFKTNFRQIVLTRDLDCGPSSRGTFGARDRDEDGRVRRPRGHLLHVGDGPKRHSDGSGPPT